MVLESEIGSQRGDRRISFRMLGATWRNSWRNSERTLESRDGGCSVRSDILSDETPRKNVHFSEDIIHLTIEVPVINNSTAPEEMEERWYKAEDYVKFEKDRVLTSYCYIASKRAGTNSFDCEKYSLRGLEILTDDKLSRRLSGEKKALQKTLREEEERQKAENGFPDMEKFRKASLKHTKTSKERALAIAQEDAKYAGRDRQQDDFLSPLPRLRQMYGDLGSRNSARKLL